jgi:hypothetical protein
MNGCRYELVRDIEQENIYDDFPQHINNICKKYGLEYLDKHGNGKGDTPIDELLKPGTIIYKGNNRHKQLLRICDSLISRLKSILPLDDIKQIASKCNQEHFGPPLDDREFDTIFKQAAGFVLPTTRTDSDNGDQELANDIIKMGSSVIVESKKKKNANSMDKKSEVDVVEEGVEKLMEEYRFLTIEESKEMYYYRNGVYVPRGETLIEKVVEAAFDLDELEEGL